MEYKREKLVDMLNDLGILYGDFQSPLIMDSSIFISLIVNIENEFDIQFPDEKLIYDMNTTATDIEEIVVSCLLNDNKVV